MGKTKEMFEKQQQEEILGEEHRAYVHWIEEEQYWRFQPDRLNLNDLDE